MGFDVKSRSLSFALFSILASCGDIGQQEDSTERAAPPSNADRSVQCNLAPQPALKKKATFRGKSVEYFTSDQISYFNDSWLVKGKPWISWDGFDTSVLGYPGYPGADRGFKVDVPANLRIVAVDVKNIDGKMHYHYFSNETANSPMENWSSTKSLVMLQAAHSIRAQTNGSHGLMSTVFGGSPSGEWIGTHVNTVARTSHNETANWFKSITGSQGSQNFVRNWIGGNGTFGGLHSSSIAPLGNRIKHDNKGTEKTLPNAMKWASNGQVNTLMPIVMAEFWKRLAVNRLDAVTWLKNANYAGPVLSAEQKKAAFFNATPSFGVQDEDLKVLLYGFVNSQQNGGLQLGATQHDEVVNAFGGKNRLDSFTKGKWRLFGKTGSGFSDERGRDEAAFGGFLCIPADPTRASLKEGRLIAFFMNIQTKGGTSKYAVRNTALRNLSKALVPELQQDASLWK